MTTHRQRRPRVLLGDLDPIARLGMSRLLVEAGVEVLADDREPAGIVDQAERLTPDVVVLMLEPAGELGRRVRAAAPAAKVILWSRDETEMQVLDPGSATPQRILRAAPDALLGELGDLASH
jgi:DNA-binding NarL/FixJ family response regulator